MTKFNISMINETYKKLLFIRLCYFTIIITNGNKMYTIIVFLNFQQFCIWEETLILFIV